MVGKKRYFNKKFNNPKTLYFILVLFIIIAAASFIFYFGFQKNILLSPVTPVSYNGLPSGFSPVLGYTHAIGGNKIVLWDANGNGYVSSTGESFTQFKTANVENTNLGLPSTFKPIIGYYLLSAGRVYLWDANGNIYFASSTSTSTVPAGKFQKLYSTFIRIDEEPLSGSNINIVTGYYRGNVQGYSEGISIWDAAGNEYFASDGRNFQKQSIVNTGLPAGRPPKVGYFNSNAKEVHLLYDLKFFSVGYNVWRFVFNSGTGGKFQARASREVKIDTSAPALTAGYFDPIRNKVVFWYGAEAYESYISKSAILFEPTWTNNKIKSIQQTSTGTSGILTKNAQDISFTTKTGEFKTIPKNCDGLVGDISGDGSIDAVDIQMEINGALGIADNSGVINACDLNGNGQIDAFDVQSVINGALGNSICGDNICGTNENSASCLSDCGLGCNYLNSITKNLVLSSAFSIESHVDEDIFGSKSYKTTKFFSGREIEIIGDFSNNMLNKVELVTNSLTKISLDITQNNLTSIIVKIPSNIDTGTYSLLFKYNSRDLFLPINITGLSLSEKNLQKSILLQKSVQYPIIKLGCFNCWWELVLSMNPTNKDIGYLIGWDFVRTLDGWKTWDKFVIDDVTNPKLKNYRGDPKITFSDDGKLILVSDLTQTHPLDSQRELITGGLYMGEVLETQFNQILLSTIPITLSVQDWIIFDYAKVSIDNNPLSPYFKNIYVFAWSVMSEDGSYGKGFFRVDKNFNIIQRKIPYDFPVGYPITSTIVGPNGELYSTRFLEIGNKLNKLLVSVSLDGGNTFSDKFSTFHIMPYSMAKTCITCNRGYFSYDGPVLAVNKQGKLYTLWSAPKTIACDPNFEFTFGYGYDFDVFISSSNDKGTTWSEPVKVNDDNFNGDQFFPSMAIDDNGAIYIAFLDHRDNQDLPQLNVYYTKSMDGGKTFTKNNLLNDIPIPITYGGRALGDYLDMVSIGRDKVFIAYPCVNIGFGNEANDACISIVDK